MKELILRRLKTSDFGTFGEMLVDGQKFHTGELPWRDNAPNLSSVPAASYVCRWLWSPNFKRKLFHLQDVPGRTVIEIHNGNWCGDSTKGLRTDVDGCILLGLGQVDDLSGQPAVTASNAALDTFHRMVGTEDFRLTIVDEYLEAGAPPAMA